MGNAILPGGYDVVYDFVGLGCTLTDALRWARAGGRVVLVGNQFEILHYRSIKAAFVFEP
jgi:threonine dehydrogenase-like Zn-dependent dehydrogenase